MVYRQQGGEGKLRELGIPAQQLSAMLPEIPKVAEAGNLPGYQITAWFGLFVPAGTPALAVSRGPGGLRGYHALRTQGHLLPGSQRQLRCEGRRVVSGRECVQLMVVAVTGLLR